MRHNQTVALAQHQVEVAARMGQRLVELYAHGIGVGYLQLLLRGGHACLNLAHRATALQGLFHHGLLVLQALHLHRLLIAHALGLVQLALQASALHVGKAGHTAALGYQVAQALVLLGQRIVAHKLHLAFHQHVLLCIVAGALAHKHLVERLQHEAWLAINHEAVFQGEAERLSHNGVGHRSLGIDDAARHKHVHHRGRLLQSACLQHKVFQCLVGSILIHTRIEHLAMNGDGLLLMHVLTGGHKQHILVLQRNVAHHAAPVCGRHACGASRHGQ